MINFLINVAITQQQTNLIQNNNPKIINSQNNNLTPPSHPMKNYQYQPQSASTQRLLHPKPRLLRTPVPFMIPSQEEYINQIAKTRLLEDELLAEKIKNETLERKSYEYIETIARLEYAVEDLRVMLQKADVEIEKHMDADKEIQSYSSNLKEVGLELSSLNEILEKKNKQCMKLLQSNNKLKQQNIQLQNKIKLLQNRKQKQKAKLRQILQGLACDNEPSFSDQLIRDIELVQEGINQLKHNLDKTKTALEKCRKQNSELLIKDKEKIISLEYSLKLAEKRNHDLQKKKTMESSLTLDRKIQDMIEQMLKKQQELSLRIHDLQLQNQSLHQQVQFQKQSHTHFLSLQKSDFQNQLSEAKQTINRLIQEKDQLSSQYQQLSQRKEAESSRQASQEVDLARKYREFCEENKRLRLKVGELEGDKRMLEKEISLRTHQ